MPIKFNDETINIYAKKFIDELLKMIGDLSKLQDPVRDNSVIKLTIDNILKSLCEEDGQYNISMLHSHDASECLKNSWFKLSTLFYMGLSNKLDHDLTYMEYYSYKNLMEEVFAKNDNKNDDASSYTKFIKYMNIPEKYIPKKFINILYNEDESKIGNKKIEEFVENLKKVDEFPTAESLRDYCRVNAAYINNKLHEMTLFATYSNNFLAELIMSNICGAPQVLPFYKGNNSQLDDKFLSTIENISIVERFNNSVFNNLNK